MGRRAVLVPVVVSLLGLGAIVAIVALQQRATSSRNAELSLSALKNDLSMLQTAPFQANAGTGGSPALATAAAADGEGGDRSDARRRSGSMTLPEALEQLNAPLAANYARSTAFTGSARPRSATTRQRTR